MAFQSNAEAALIDLENLERNTRDGGRVPQLTLGATSVLGVLDGAVNGIAGIVNANGRVLAVMPLRPDRDVARDAAARLSGRQCGRRAAPAQS